jgi:hypothetical protein
MKIKNTGVRFARFSFFGRMSRRQTFSVPIEMLSLAAGDDAWMRGVEFACADCRKLVAAKDAECCMCAECYDKAGAENARLDGVK